MYRSDSSSGERATGALSPRIHNHLQNEDDFAPLLYQKLTSRLQRLLRAKNFDTRLAEQFIGLVQQHLLATQQNNDQERKNIEEKLQEAVVHLKFSHLEYQQRRTKQKNIYYIKKYHLEHYGLSSSTPRFSTQGQHGFYSDGGGGGGGDIESKRDSSIPRYFIHDVSTCKYPELASLYALDDLLSWWDIGSKDEVLIENNIKQLLSVTPEDLAVRESPHIAPQALETHSLYTLDDLAKLTPDTCGILYNLHTKKSLDFLKDRTNIISPIELFTKSPALTLCPTADRYNRHGDYPIGKHIENRPELKRKIQQALHSRNTAARCKAVEAILKDSAIIEHKKDATKRPMQYILGSSSCSTATPQFARLLNLVNGKLMPKLSNDTDTGCEHFLSQPQLTFNSFASAINHYLNAHLSHTNEIYLKTMPEQFFSLIHPRSLEQNNDELPIGIVSKLDCIRKTGQRRHNNYSYSQFAHRFDEIHRLLNRENNSQTATRLQRQLMAIMQFLSPYHSMSIGLHPKIRYHFEQQMLWLLQQPAEIWPERVEHLYHQATRLETQHKHSNSAGDLTGVTFFTSKNFKNIFTLLRLDLLQVSSFVTNQINNLRPKATKNRSESTHKYNLYQQLQNEIHKLLDEVENVNASQEAEQFSAVAKKIKAIIFKTAVISHHRRHSFWDKITLKQCFSHSKSWQAFKAMQFLNPDLEKFSLNLQKNSRSRWGNICPHDIAIIASNAVTDIEEDTLSAGPAGGDRFQAATVFQHYSNYLGYQKALLGKRTIETAPATIQAHTPTPYVGG